jgi:hypothetical protein
MPYQSISAQVGFLCAEADVRHAICTDDEFSEAMFIAHPAIARYRDRNRKQYAKDLAEMREREERTRKGWQKRKASRDAASRQMAAETGTEQTQKPIEHAESEISIPAMADAALSAQSGSRVIREVQS